MNMRRLIHKHKRKILYTAPVVFSFVFGYLSLVPTQTQNQVEIILTPLSIKSTVGSTFTVDVSIKTDIPINVVEASLIYPSEMIFATSTDNDGSIIDLWSQPPTILNDIGKIMWGGGMLRIGGFVSSGKILSIKFIAKEAGSGEIRIDNASFAIADGKGTILVPNSSALTYTIEPKTTNSNDTVEIITDAPTTTGLATTGVTMTENTSGDEVTTAPNIGTMVIKIFSSYDKQYDLNNDGKVDFFDFSTLFFRTK